MGDGGVVDHAAVDQQSFGHLYRRKDTGNGRRRRYGIDRWSVGEQQLASLGQIEGHEMQRDRRVRQIVELDVPADAPAQPAVGDELVTPTAYAAYQRAGPEREDVVALQVAPDSVELSCRRRRLRARCDERRVESTHGRTHSPGPGSIRTPD
jgi:hypothetical protein